VNLTVQKKINSSKVSFNIIKINDYKIQSKFSRMNKRMWVDVAKHPKYLHEDLQINQHLGHCTITYKNTNWIFIFSCFDCNKNIIYTILVFHLSKVIFVIAD